MTPEEAYRQIQEGNFSCLVGRGAVPDLALSASWTLAFRAASQLITGTRLLSPADVESLIAGSLDDPRGLRLACADGALRAVLDMDRTQLTSWCQALDALASRTAASDVTLERDTARGWLRLFEGDAASSLRLAQTAGRRASTLKAASATVESTALESLALLSLDRVSAALGSARRASRMARTEGILQREYLANLVLARARRFSDQPHAAARILIALRQVVPRPWHGWLDWELLLCQGDAPPARSSPRPPSFQAGACGSQLFYAAQAGHRERFTTIQHRLFEGMKGWTDLSAEAFAMVGALDPAAALDDAPPSVRPWLRGDGVRTPPALRGLSIPHINPDGEELAAVFVVASPRGGGKRVLGRGLGLLAHGPEVEASRFNLSRGRVFTALSALALARAQRLDDEDLFQAVYRFPYVHSKHQGTLRVLLHRMRKEVGQHGQITREHGATSLALEATLVVPDPRCTPTTEELVLRTLASHGGKATLRQLALALSLSPRTVQRAVRTVVEDGSCQTVGAGPETGYELEDTTFYQPTLTRLRHRSGEPGEPRATTAVTSALLAHYGQAQPPTPAGDP